MTLLQLLLSTCVSYKHTILLKTLNKRHIVLQKEVDHIQNLTSCQLVTLVILSLPIVDIKVELKASSENLTRIHVFPTPLSPINSSLKRKS